MTWLAVIVDAIRGLKGGAICSVINSYVLNGAPGTRDFISKLLREVSTPMLTMIKTWMLEGELNDPYQEFFVVMDPTVPDSRLWTDKYSLNYQMIPSFLTHDIALQILQTGKAVNFIRRCCHEDDWVMETDFDIGEWVNDRSDFESLRKWVDRVAEERNRALIEILFEKYRFFGHCEAIRRYLLLGQGDFVQALMTAMAEEL
jgi:gamma-tubulin complex component 3